MCRIWGALFLFLVGCAGQPIQYSRRPAEAMKQAEELTCFRMTWDKRQEVLSLADPANFPGVRYRKGPRDRAAIEKETDCSSFVHEIYKRAGLPYNFRATRDLKSAPEFQVVPEFAARPGDLMVFRGHVGIVDLDGQIISATRVRSKRQPSSITRMPANALGRRRAVLRYTCPNETQASVDLP